MMFDLDDTDYLYLQILENRGQVTMSSEDEVLAHIEHSFLEDKELQETMGEFEHACAHSGCPACELQRGIEILNDLGMTLDTEEVRDLGARLTPHAICELQSVILMLAMITDGFVDSLEDPENEE